MVRRLIYWNNYINLDLIWVIIKVIQLICIHDVEKNIQLNYNLVKHTIRINWTIKILINWYACINEYYSADLLNILEEKKGNKLCV